ncbi:MAG: DEAD/DEAH box helicase [Nitrospirae bacterium]|nr:DEAD/DEAH box helicase [Nitrospirota bacterium]
MLFETPEDTYNAYLKFLKKKEYRKAYRCLEKMLYQFPNDSELLEDIVELCVTSWHKPEMSKPWLIKLAKIRGYWLDYIMLSRVEAALENISKAKGYLEKAKELRNSQPFLKSERSPKMIFEELEGFIKFKEWNLLAKRELKGQESVVRSRGSGVWSEKKKRKQAQVLKTRAVGSESGVQAEKKPVWKEEKPVIRIPSYSIPIKIEPFSEKLFTPISESNRSNLHETLMLIDYAYLSIQSGFDELLCLNAITDVEKYWYQIETARKVLKHFRGRALLCDEVGLGKTIEAGMLMKEYIMRGMVRNVLILTPASLVSQWREEIQAKFGLEFMTTDDLEFMNDPVNFWKQRFIIASINTAKSSKNMPLVTEQFYDLVIVDEAHHLRNRTTLSWKLVNQIKKKFIFLLTATPVQNNLIELFNLITLLKPGQFKTEKQFKEEYIRKGNLKSTADREKLRELLRDVMIRNTRSAIDLKLPKRFAVTTRLEPTAIEKDIYTGISEYLKRHNLKKSLINLLLREAGSSPFAIKNTLLNLHTGQDIHKNGLGNILEAIDSLEDICKGKALIEILMKNPDEKKIIFTHFVKSMDYITDLLLRREIPHVTFRGNMALREKNSAISSFKNEVPVIVSTESGGEGRNLQFCNTIINFDLPWNPMRIEQRIGRLHRIGQTRDVFIFNLSIRGTIEDYIIEILDSKINMFEMVIGEIEPILGHLGDDVDFEDIIMDIWLKSSDKEGLNSGFEQFGNELLNAKQRYLNSKVMDNEILGDDYET